MKYGSFDDKATKIWNDSFELALHIMSDLQLKRERRSILLRKLLAGR